MNKEYVANLDIMSEDDLIGELSGSVPRSMDKMTLLKILVVQSRKIDALETRINNIENGMLPEHNGVYTDEELYELKQQLSWKKLSERTNIKVSSLQYRLRRYRDDTLHG